MSEISESKDSLFLADFPVQDSFRASWNQVNRAAKKVKWNFWNMILGVLQAEDRNIWVEGSGL